MNVVDNLTILLANDMNVEQLQSCVCVERVSIGLSCVCVQIARVCSDQESMSQRNRGRLERKFPSSEPPSDSPARTINGDARPRSSPCSTRDS